MIAGKARFKAAKKIEKAAGYHIPDSAFHAGFLEAVTSRVNFEYLDGPLREQLLQFFREFLSCECRDRPLCGCPEKRFVRRIIELREDGLDHHQISSELLEEYGINLYPADILSFLEDSVHLLEAVKDIAELQGMKPIVADTERHIQRIVR